MRGARPLFRNNGLPGCVATVVIPTLAADDALAECLASLAAQTFRNFEIVVVDNSGSGLVRKHGFSGVRGIHLGVRIVEMKCNVGFGAAINAAYMNSEAPFVATLNDDAVASAGWLAALVAALENNPNVGLCASQVRLQDGEGLDSAGMLICADGSSKQRGHREPPGKFALSERVLMPSASAAIYRRSMVDEIGFFDGDFFLYCEDTDLGLRAARAGWECLYVPDAVVEHRYSHSAGRVSPLKAYYVERNRIFVAIKNFPLRLLAAMPFVAIARYAWHLWFMLRGRGSAARFQQEGHGGWRLGWFVLKAHIAACGSIPQLLAKRRRILRDSKIPEAEFTALLRRFSIPARELAEF